MEKNGFGLAWDDKLPAGGDYQQYTKYNAPHKISLYLSLGIPVIVWQQAAIAEMVQKLGLGIVIAGIEEIDHKLGELTDEEMLRMKNNVLSFSCLLRSGIFTRTALVDSEVKILLNKGANQE
ncbi:Glycosyltransferase [Enterococcus sp. HSIEG1]|nr:Glycosyltransferase [Enterococcus sp. HSIEG1]